MSGVDELVIELVVRDRRAGELRYGVRLESEQGVQVEVIKGVVANLATRATEDVKVERARQEGPGQQRLSLLGE